MVVALNIAFYQFIGMTPLDRASAEDPGQYYPGREEVAMMLRNKGAKSGKEF